MAKAKGCKRAPEINGELSSLYLDLFELAKLKLTNVEEDKRAAVARLLTNVLYVQYAANQQLQLSLDNANKMRNSQDQHEASDVFTALNGDELVKYTEINELDTLSIAEGIKLDTIHSIDFNAWQQAYQKARDINAANPTLSAYVIQRNGKYQVKVANMNSLNMVDRVRTEMETQEMLLIENALSSVGLNLDALTFRLDTMFGRNYQNLINWLKNIPLTRPNLFMKTDIKMLIQLFLNEQIVDRLLTKFGGVDALVDIYYDWYRNNYTATPTTQTLLQAAIDVMHKLNGLDGQALDDAAKLIEDNVKQNSVDYQALALFDQLNQKFELERLDLEVSKEHLLSLTNVMAYTIKALGQQVKALRSVGDRQRSQELLDRMLQLNRDLELKEYSSSIAEFLTVLSDRLNDILNNLVTQIPQGADMTFMNERGMWLRKAAQYLEVYKPIVDSLVSMEERDINISDQDMDSLQREATRLSNTISEITTAVSRGIDNWAKQTLSLMLVENSEIAIDDVMSCIRHDATWFDRMYNATKISHIPTAVMANFIQTTRRQRTQKMAQIAQRIGEIANTTVTVNGKKYSVNRDTSFMYEKIEAAGHKPDAPKYEYYMLSEYDWEGFNKEKRKQYGRLKKRGLSEYALELAMERWMLNNTQEIVVDQNNGRTERVPKKMKQVNPLNSLNPAQREAYEQFKALKAEIDSMLPEFARGLYIPPQLRKGAIDLLTSSKNPLVGIGRAISEKWLSTFGVREDEVGVGQVIETDTGNIVTSYTDMTGSTDHIPINYIQRLENQEELLHNFAEGISHLAQSAINYDTMKEIEDTIEILGDYIKDKVSPMLNGADMAQGILYGSKLFYERIKKGKDTNVAKIIEDQKRRLLYNDTTAGRSIKAAKRWAFYRKIVSINALTFNLFGAIHNALEGYRKNLENAITPGDDTFNLVDLERAHYQIFVNHVAKGGSHIHDFFTGRKTSLGGLIMERFDPKKEKYHEITNKKYRTNLFRTAISKDLTMVGYSIGETLNNMPIVYARLFHIKVVINGKSKNNLGVLYTLYDALETIQNQDGTVKLGIKANATLENGKEITEEYLDLVSREINEISERSHGGMSDEAMGELMTTTLGLLTAQLRRWMIGVYSNYFRGTYVDTSTGKRVTGAWKGIYDVTVGSIVEAAYKNRPLENIDNPSFAEYISSMWLHMPWSKEFVQDVLTFKLDLILHYKNLKPHQRLAAVRWLTATSLMTTISVLIDAFVKGHYKDDKDEEWFKVVFYLLSRLRMDVAVTVPDLNHLERIGQVGNSFVEIMDKPFAAASTTKDYVGLVSKRDKKGEIIERGSHEGEDKYWRHVRKTLWKPGELWNRIEGLSDTDELINSLGGFEGFSAKKEYERLVGVEEKKETAKERKARKKREKKKAKEKKK